MQTLTAAAAIAIATLGASLAYASNDALQPIKDCTAIAAPEERLSCFDREIAKLTAAEATGAVAIVDVESVRKAERASFGLPTPDLAALIPSFGRKDQSEDVSEVVARITQVRGDARSGVTLMLDNGQVWAQTDTERAYGAKVGEQVRIRRAALGSFLLSFERGGGALRVRRIS